MFFPATGTQPGSPPWADFVNFVIGTINAATTTFLTGYIGLRFMGQTRAWLGMQQWPQTCSVEISTLGGVVGELDLLTNILDNVYHFGGLPHWGQILDPNIANNPSAGQFYAKYSLWRDIYGNLSNNFTTRTFENALSVRAKLTTP